MQISVTRWSVLQAALALASLGFALLGGESDAAQKACLVALVASLLVPSVQRSISKTMAPGDRAISRAVVAMGIFVLAMHVLFR